MTLPWKNRQKLKLKKNLASKLVYSRFVEVILLLMGIKFKNGIIKYVSNIKFWLLAGFWWAEDVVIHWSLNVSMLLLIHSLNFTYMVLRGHTCSISYPHLSCFKYVHIWMIFSNQINSVVWGWVIYGKMKTWLYVMQSPV